MTTIPIYRAPAREPVEPEPPWLIDVREAARLLRVSEKTLWNQTAPRGPIPAVHIGRSVRYSRAALEEFIRERLATRETA